MIEFEKFVFQTPLYSKFSLGEEIWFKALLYGVQNTKIDGYCVGCEKTSTFRTSNPKEWDFPVGSSRIGIVQNLNGIQSTSITCARDNSHKITLFYDLSADSVEKIGQLPSLADIANDEATEYRSILSKEDSSEFHKAIGLAAHGVGIGSFAYLRRVFERLVYARFEESKGVQKWQDEDFYSLRMNQKIEFLKDFLPPFLVEHSKMYSILSKGIHELTDEECLNAFEPLKLSLKIILEEDKKRKEEAELREMASASIKGFSA